MKKAELIQCGNIGMVRDKATSLLNALTQDFAWDNHNIRITVNQDNTLLAITNEKGTLLQTSLEGLKLGTNILNNYLTIFTTLGTKFTFKFNNAATPLLTNLFSDIMAIFLKYGIVFSSYEQSTMLSILTSTGAFETPVVLINKTLRDTIYEEIYTLLETVGNLDFVILTFTDDRIYRVDDNYTDVLLYSGSLNFYPDYPIETLSYYESETVQKVYWVDGLNTNRFINIVGIIRINDDTLFDCTGHIYQVPLITINKNYAKIGLFPEGTVLYFVTYYNKFGTESGIVWQSDLQYLSLSDRGCKEGENAQGAFEITIDNVDTTHYDFLRIYSVIKTSAESTPIAAIVCDLPTNSFIQGGVPVALTITDYNTNHVGYAADDLLFAGGLNIIASTLDLKRDTLFLGDVTLHDTKLTNQDVLYLLLQNFSPITEENINITYNTPDITFDWKPIPTPTINGVYSHENLLNESQEEIAGFKYRELYRFALQFQTIKGEWIEPIYIGDKYCNLAPKLDTGVYYVPAATYTMNAAAKAELDKWNDFHPESKFIQVRLLVAEMTNDSRRIAALGVVNPTMFNYYHRAKNTPDTINSWMFRPRKSLLTNRHYDCMQPQDSNYAEIQGINQRKSPSFDPNNSNNSIPNSYGLIIALTGDWITLHELYYELYYYYNDGGIDVCSDAVYGPLACSQASHNTYLYSFSNSTVEALQADPSLKLNNKDLVRQWLINELNKHDLHVTDDMIPLGIDFKNMRLATLFTNNPGLIWAVVGAAIVTAAAVALTICTLGTSAPLGAAAIGTVWSAVLGGVGAVTASLGAAGVASIAEQLKDAPDVDLLFAKKGFYTLLPEFNHKRKNKLKWEEQYDGWIDNLLGALYSANCIKSIKDTNRSAAVLIQRIGRVSYLTQEDLNALDKQEQYYVDESIVTLNSPDIENNQFIIDNSEALQLDLIGTIPITASHGQSLMYTNTKGVASSAQHIPTIISKPHSSLDIEGLINGGLYQDILLQQFEFDATELKWPDIEPTDLLSVYKIFMWNRTTSWSCHIPQINIKDALQLNDETTTYINYIPAIPKKKVFANLKYSCATNYQLPYTLAIEPPKIYHLGYQGITPFTFNNTQKWYYGYVDDLIINTEGYVLLQGNNVPFWLQPSNAAFDLKVYDPVSIKFNSTSHVLIPFQWQNEELTLLPYVDGENPVTLTDYYDDITKTSIVRGLKITDEIFGMAVSELPEWVPTASYPTDPLLTFNDGDIVPNSIVDLYKILLINSQIPHATIQNIFNTIPTITYICEEHVHTDATNLCPSANIIYINVVPDITILNSLVDAVYNSFNMLSIKWCNANQTKYLEYVNEAGVYVWKCFDVKDTLLLEDYKFTLNTGSNGTISAFTLEIATLLEAELESAIEQAMYSLFLEAKGSTTLTMDEFIETQHPSESELKARFETLVSMPWNDYWLDRIDMLAVSSTTSTNLLIFNVNAGTGFATRLNTTFNNQTKLSWIESNPYLFMGELTKKQFDYPSWLGGVSDFALLQLNWNICSNAVDSLSPILKTWGDTYYQRWDCLKTYPITEEDNNSVVDILSFMVETHINIDGRCDINRGITNLINARPTNFNLINTAYTQNSNFFTYKITDDKFDDNTLENQIVWSLTKIPMSDIDLWTNINTVNYLNLNGSYGQLRKLLNLNDVLLAFLDTGISSINYDLKAALSTTLGVPVLLGNTNKVDGYTVISSKHGCHNKWSICNTDNGVFFIDDYNKSLFLFSNNQAPVNVGMTYGFEQWFKDNIDGTIWNPLNTNAFRLSYDLLTKDVYITRNIIDSNESCLVYNVSLQKFTSFMDYPASLIFNFRLNSTALYLNGLTVDVYKMFDGPYNVLFSLYKPYWISYRLNPSPYTDNLFTNFTYVADWINPASSIDDPMQLNPINAHYTFNQVTAWNEYLYGTLDLTTVRNRHRHSKDRYRIWHGDIPRDGDTLTTHVNGGDRMRNPWLFLKLTQNDPNNWKMVFHNLTVTYYK